MLLVKESDQAWIYAMNGARHGPASAREVAALISSDRLPITALVWKPGMTDWVAASDVPEIASRCAPLPGGPEILTIGGCEDGKESFGTDEGGFFTLIPAPPSIHRTRSARRQSPRAL